MKHIKILKLILSGRCYLEVILKTEYSLPFHQQDYVMVALPSQALEWDHMGTNL